MTPFRERNPVVIGAVALAIIGLLVYAAFNVSSLPFIGNGPVYHADFADASGLAPSDAVRIAGVPVGKVTGIGLQGDHAVVDFTVDPGTSLGVDSSASIQLETIVGTRYLELDPAGPGQLKVGATIPESRTTTLFSVEAAFGGLSQHIQAINTAQLAKEFNVIAGDFRNSPADVRAAVSGLTRLSQTISTRNTALHELLVAAQGVTGVLASRDAQLTVLINDGDLVLKVLEQRDAIIHQLLLNTSAMATQLTGLVQDDEATLAPALANLEGVVKLLASDHATLTRTVSLLGPFIRDFTNVLGNGRWFDTYVYGLIPPNGGLPPGVG